MALTVNEGTQTDVYTQALGGGTEIGVVRLDIGTGASASAWGGTTPRVSNVGTLELGSVVLTSSGGTITRVGNVGTVELGSVTVTGLPSGGTILRVGNIGTLELGSVAVTSLPSGGTILRVGNLGTLELGSVAVTSMPSGGTIANNQLTGTLTTGTLALVTTVSNLTNGTVTAGTIQTIGLRHADEFATVVTSGTSTLGTIRAAVTGSAIYVTGIVVSVQAASNVVVASGGTANPILGTLFFAGSGGVAAMPFDPPIRTASGSALVYQQSANTGLTLSVVGYID